MSACRQYFVQLPGTEVMASYPTIERVYNTIFRLRVRRPPGDGRGDLRAYFVNRATMYAIERELSARCRREEVMMLGAIVDGRSAWLIADVPVMCL